MPRPASRSAPSKSNWSKSGQSKSASDDRSKGTRKIGTIVSQLMSRRGYASVGVEHAMTASVAAAVGPGLNESFQVGKLNRGVLHIYVVDSVTMQEFTFQKRQIQKRLLKDHPQAKITDIRFRLQAK